MGTLPLGAPDVKQEDPQSGLRAQLIGHLLRAYNLKQGWIATADLAKAFNKSEYIIVLALGQIEARFDRQQGAWCLIWDDDEAPSSVKIIPNHATDQSAQSPRS